MISISERERARLALRLLESGRMPKAGDRVLIWAHVERIEDDNLMAKVTTEIREHAFLEQRVWVLLSDVVLSVSP